MVKNTILTLQKYENHALMGSVNYQVYGHKFPELMVMKKQFDLNHDVNE